MSGTKLQRTKFQRTVRYVMFGVFTGAAALLVSPLIVQADTSAPEEQGTWHKFTKLGFKFDGASTCAGSNCHGGSNTSIPPSKRGSEQKIWATRDKHAKAANSIIKADLKKFPWMKDIGTKLGLKGTSGVELLNDAKCLSCHSAQLDDSLLSAKKTVKATEGVTCFHCHGPYSGWEEPHKTKGWTQTQRDGMTHDALLTKFGLFDTKAVMHRAEMCASCHLKMDDKLVDAGHPQPIFEQVAFQKKENPHWIDPNVPNAEEKDKVLQHYYVTKLWAAGQVIALRDAMEQLASRIEGKASEAAIKNAYDQAMAHLVMVEAAFDAKVYPGDKAALEAAAKPLADKPDAAAATAVAKLVGEVADKVKGEKETATYPDKAATLAILNAVAGNADLVKAHGRRAAEQQYYAVSDLYLVAYAKAEKADAAMVKKVTDLLAPMGKAVDIEDKNAALDAAKFTTDLAAAAALIKDAK